MYVIDTSSLINLNRYYRRTTFTAVWQRIESLIANGTLIAPHEVKREIERGDDFLVEWAKGVADFFVDPSDEQGGIIADIHARFPQFIGLLKPGVDADPWCVALGVVKTQAAPGSPWTVVNEERPSHPYRMPSVCKSFGLPSLKLLDFFDALGGF